MSTILELSIFDAGFSDFRMDFEIVSLFLNHAIFCGLTVFTGYSEENNCKK